MSEVDAKKTKISYIEEYYSNIAHVKKRYIVYIEPEQTKITKRDFCPYVKEQYYKILSKQFENN